MRPRLRSTAPKGYALLWILVFTAIVAVLAAASLPYLAPVNAQARADSAIAQLRAVGNGIAAFTTTVHSSTSSSTNNFPGRLSQLTRVIRPGVDRNSCWTGSSGGMTAHDSTDWVDNGPFVAFLLPDAGLWTPIGRLRDSIPQRAANGEMFVEMSGVQHSDMLLVDDAIDHGVADTVLLVYHAPLGGAPDTGTLRFRVLNAATASAINKC